MWKAGSSLTQRTSKRGLRVGHAVRDFLSFFLDTGPIRSSMCRRQDSPAGYSSDPGRSSNCRDSQTERIAGSISGLSDLTATRISHSEIFPNSCAESMWKESRLVWNHIHRSNHAKPHLASDAWSRV